MNRLRAESLVAGFEPVTLEELERATPLRERLDLKYIVPTATFERLAEGIVSTHRALEIDERRIFHYESLYFDSASLQAYRDHVQRRRRRYKARSRHYVDSGSYTFEVKLKGGRGETVKRRLEREAALHATIDPEARTFLDRALAEAYGRRPTDSLDPVLRTDYRRLTFVAGSGGQKLTCDFGLSLRPSAGSGAVLRSDHVIIESKAERGGGQVDRILRRLGARPVACSKYCMGVALTVEGVKTNQFRRLARRYFTVEPRAAGPPVEPRGFASRYENSDA